MRKVVILPLLVLLCLGFLIGLLLCPIWFGVLTANEMVGDFIDKARRDPPAKE